RGALPARATPAEDRDARPDPLEQVEQPGAAGIDAEVVDGDVAAGDECGSDEQRRSGREVARNVDLLEPQRPRWLDGHRRGAAAHAGARRLEHALGVVA